MPASATMSAGRSGGLSYFRAQVPFLIGASFLVALVAVSLPEEAREPMFVTATALTLVATVGAFAVPWDRFSRDWVVFVPMFDVGVVALFRTTLLEVLPGAGILIILPVLWLGYGFSYRAAIFAVVGAFFVSVFPFLASGGPPDAIGQWADILVLPVMVSVIVVTVHLAARQFLTQHRRLKEASASLKQTVQRLSDEAAITASITEAAGAGIAFVDPSGTLQMSNRVARELNVLSGAGPGNWFGAHVFRSDGHTRIDAEDQLVARALRGEINAETVTWLGPDGSRRAVIASFHRVTSPDEEMLGTVLAIQDVTDLVDAVTVRENFLNSISHELRTPADVDPRIPRVDHR